MSIDDPFDRYRMEGFSRGFEAGVVAGVFLAALLGGIGWLAIPYILHHVSITIR